MSINFSTKNVKFPGALKAFTETQLKNIEKIAGYIIDADINVNQEKIDFKVEITLKTSLSSFHGEGRDRILKQALREAINAVKTQVKKNKEKIKEEKKRIPNRPVQKKEGPISKLLGKKAKKKPAGEKREDEKVRVVLSENFSLKPISVEEAIFFLNESNDNCYMFINSDTNRMSAIYWNKQGSYSLIEPEM